MKKCEEIIQKALKQGHSSLLLPEAQQVVSAHYIPTPKAFLAKNVEEAIKKGSEIGFPVVLKIVSPMILHKSDVGGVALNVNSPEELKEAYQKMIKEVSRNTPDEQIIGVSVEKMLPSSTEVIVGGIRDSQFGPSVMFGMGGIFAEVYEDVAFRVAPLDKIDALNLINGLKGSKILKGIRGNPPADMEALADILLNVSSLMIEHSSISQLDLNPVLVYPDSAYAVDYRIILKQPEGGK